MKIAFMDVFQQGNNAEKETTVRLKYCFEKQGHKFFVIDKNGIVIDNSLYKGQHIENTDIEVFYTFNHFENIPVLPNKKAIFFHWSPSGFLPPFWLPIYISNMNCYDDVFGGYESEDAYMDVVSANMENASLIPIGSSVPLDFCIKPNRKNNKLFYVGINLEKKLGKQRFGELFRLLDNKDKISFYGPNSVFGITGCWDSYKNYKGSIPFDGKTIINKINECGICLALNSPTHNDAGTVSNRIYEAAAAGAIIISDDNNYVRKYFGDSVFYVDISKNENELCSDILNILLWIDEHPNDAYTMALQAQKVFKQKLNLDNMVSQVVCQIKQNETQIQSDDIIDIIAFIESEEDYKQMIKTFENKNIVNLNIICVSNIEISSQEKTKLKITFINRQGNYYKGKSFAEIKSQLKGNFFMFWDKFSDMQNRHLYKMYKLLAKYENENFVYSGCYVKKYSSNKNSVLCYDILNASQIGKDDFLLFQNAYINMEEEFALENIFARACILLKKDILKYTKDNELNQIRDNIHLYLAVCSILRGNSCGIFSKTITAGYGIKENENLQVLLSEQRKNFFENTRCEKLSFKELNRIFLYENHLIYRINPNCYPKQIINSNIESFDFYNKLKKHKILYFLVSILSNHKRRKYRNKKERILNYCQKHKLINRLVKFRIGGK